MPRRPAPARAITAWNWSRDKGGENSPILWNSYGTPMEYVWNPYGASRGQHRSNTLATRNQLASRSRFLPPPRLYRPLPPPRFQGEGETIAAPRQIAASRCSQQRTAGHPLPRGEGRGEGELGSRCFHALRMSEPVPIQARG